MSSFSGNTGAGRKPDSNGINPLRLLVDVGVAVALVAALAVVFALDRGTTSSDAPDRVEEVVVANGDDDLVPLDYQPLRLAVTPPEYDDMGKLLDTLGEGYRYTIIDYNDLLVADRLGRYDVVFLTCSGVPRQWLSRRVRESERGGGGVFRPRRDVMQMVRTSLRTFVAQGGTLYVSDFHFSLLANCFREFVDRSKVGRGAEQTVTADVVDSGLKRRLGPTIELRFDKPSWRPAAFEGPKVTEYLRGTYKTTKDDEVTAPLLVKIPFGRGTIIFTSFHNEAQNSEMELELLHYLVFASVTADLEADVKRTMTSGGFSPVHGNLLSASAADQSLTETYHCDGRRDLQFVLGFKRQGARLRLVVVGPEGRRLEKAGTSTITLDVPDAAAGDWRYTVTPLEVPYENFPYTLTVGEKR